jgi:hypothetical protein
MKLTITEISVHFEGESPIFGELSTIVKLEDEGAGYFVTIGQDEHIIRLGFKEFDTLFKAVEMLKQQDGVWQCT